MIFKVGLGYRKPGEMRFKCYWYIQIGNHIMLSMHNHLDKPFFKKMHIIDEPGRTDTMFGIGGLQVHYHTFPIQWL